MRLLPTNPRAITRDSAIVLATSSTAALLAFARDVAVGRELGLGMGLDVWVLAIATTGVLASAATTATSATVLPTFRRAAASCGCDPTPEEVASSAMLVAYGLGLAGGVVVYLGAELFADVMVPRASASQFTEVTRLLALTAVPGLVVRGSAGSLLQADRRFGMAGISPAIPAAAVLVLLSTRANDVADVARAHAAGALLEAVLLTLAIVLLVGAALPSPGTSRRIAKLLFAGLGPAFVGGLAFSINPVVDLVVAARLGSGEAGQLGLASRLTIATAALLASSLATPAFPRFVDALSEGGPRALRTLQSAVLRRGMLMGMGLTIVIALTSLPLATIIFTGGELSADDGTSIAKLQMIYALTAAPYVLTTISLRVLHALGEYRRAMAIGVAACIVNLIADVGLSRLVGVEGIALATLLVYTLSATSMLALARVRMQERL